MVGQIMRKDLEKTPSGRGQVVGGLRAAFMGADQEQRIHSGRGREAA